MTETTPTQLDGTRRENIHPGSHVLIVLKKDQRTGKTTEGFVQDILTKSPRHTRGIKVRLTTMAVGRVKTVLPTAPPPAPQSPPKESS